MRAGIWCRWAIPAAALLAVVVGLVLALVIVAAAGSSVNTTTLGTTACVISGQVASLTAAQSSNADTIVSVALAVSGGNQKAAQIAVMTAMTESDLENLNYGTSDSLGLFQQQPDDGWGTAAQVMDPKYATTGFVQHLLAVPGWASIPPWLAAQTVQRSAFGNGSNYQSNWSAAVQVTQAVIGRGNTTGSCGQGVAGSLTASVSGHGLPAGYQIPAGTPAKHAAVVAYALAQLGKPYVWGAAGPNAFDCSGLTMAAWATVGVTLVHYTGTQEREGSSVTASQLVPGDLVLVPGVDAPASGVAGHVGIYLGDGLVESAIDPSRGVAVQSWATFVSGGLDALRDPAPGQ